MERKKIVVLGGGESGFGAAVLAQKQGFDVFLSDRKEISPETIEMLEKHGVEFEHGQHTEAKILAADEVVKSPGIPDKAPIVQAIREKGIPVVSEIEFAGRYTDARTICITGSNGKTTTTTLIHDIMQAAGMNAGLAGNIGQSFAYQAATERHDWYVLELSSFQLDGMFDFRADIALLMNITPDHLDRYDYNMQNYIDSKFRIVRNQSACDSFIYCSDDINIKHELKKRVLPMARFPFSVKHKTRQSAWWEEGEIIVRVNRKEFRIATKDLAIKGIHNTYNAMGAIIATMIAGVPHEIIRKVLTSFKGVEHRLEFAGRKNGVTYINDSKATNVDSVWYALESMPQPVIWIAGGQDKGNDYSQLYKLVPSKVKALVCMGVDNEKLKKAFTGRIDRIYDTHSLADAFKAVGKEAVEGDIVLLSPACASFDLFKNYEERGEKFKKKVKRL